MMLFLEIAACEWCKCVLCENVWVPLKNCAIVILKYCMLRDSLYSKHDKLLTPLLVLILFLVFNVDFILLQAGTALFNWFGGKDWSHPLQGWSEPQREQLCHFTASTFSLSCWVQRFMYSQHKRQKMYIMNSDAKLSAALIIAISNHTWNILKIRGNTLTFQYGLSLSKKKKKRTTTSNAKDTREKTSAKYVLKCATL